MKHPSQGFHNMNDCKYQLLFSIKAPMNIGFPWIILVLLWFELTRESRMLFLNSLPLSLWRMWGIPSSQNKSCRTSAASSAYLFFRGRNRISLVKWSWYTKSQRYGIPDSDMLWSCDMSLKSMRSTDNVRDTW